MFARNEYTTNILCFLLVVFTAVLTSFPCFALTLHVKITGVDEPTEKMLANSLAIYRAIGEAKLSEARIKNLHDRATSQLLDALEAIGFYNAKVTANLTATVEDWHASYAINMGKPTTICSINLTLTGAGKNNAELKKAATTPKLHINSIVTHQDYEATKQSLLTCMHDQGFLGAKFIRNKLKINRHTNTAEVELAIDTGNRYYFGATNFNDTKYANDFLQRFVPFSIGAPYTTANINLLHKNLSDSDLFSKIRIDPELTPNLQVPLSVRLIDKPLDRYTGSFGYGTDTSFRGSLGWQHRRVVPAGHQFNTGVNGSKIRKQLFANYAIPGNHIATDKYVIGTSLTEETILKKFSRKSEVSISKIKKISAVQTFWTMQYLMESFKVIPDEIVQTKRYLLPSVKASWIDSPDEDAKLIQGKKLDLTLRGGLNMVLSSTDLVQTEAAAKWIAPLTTQTRLITRCTLGYTAAKNFDSIPFSLRYFAGGDNSVRGFAYQSLGPKEKDAEGGETVIGGKHLVDASIELDRSIYNELHGAIFIDAGNAMNNWNTNLAVGAGAGIRWNTKVGVFRIDLARQVRRIESKNIRLHLTFGTDL